LEPGNGGGRPDAVGHLDTAKAFGAASVTISHDPTLVYHTLWLKALVQVIVDGGERSMPNSNIDEGFLVANGATIARSSEQYAGANHARAPCRGKRREEPRGHKVHLIIT
jgi:hypothetical protein